MTTHLRRNIVVLQTHQPQAIIKSAATRTSMCTSTSRARKSRIDTTERTRESDESITSLRHMNNLAKKLRKKRIASGALTLASPEVKFVIDTETQDPLDVGMYQTLETNQMVEEMMLLANISVAEKIVKHFPSCSLLRRHPVPATACV
eukprot:gene31431-6607_t